MTLVNFGDWAAQWDELEEAWSVSYNMKIWSFLRMVFDEDNGDLVLIMNGGWVVMTKECWQVLLQLFHGGVHMEPAGPTQGSLSLNYQSFEIWISQFG